MYRRWLRRAAETQMRFRLLAANAADDPLNR